jgi:hypothetical protein
MSIQPGLQPVLLRCTALLFQEFEAGLLLAAVKCAGPCKCRLAALLTRDLQRVLEGCRQQLHELLSSTTEQMFVVNAERVRAVAANTCF